MDIRTTPAWTGVLALLAGCATEPPAADTVATNCSAQEPRTGSLIVRKRDCDVSTPEAREAARRQMETMQREQERRSINKGQASGG